MLAAALLCAACESKPKRLPYSPEAWAAAQRETSARSAAQMQAIEAADAAKKQAAADRRFRSDVEADAEMFVHEALIKEHGRAMPEHWREKGEMIKREGNFSLVMVHTGIKEGLLSELVVVQNYIMSVELRGKAYATTEALRYGREPTAAQLAVLMIKGKWPSAPGAK